MQHHRNSSLCTKVNFVTDGILSKPLPPPAPTGLLVSFIVFPIRSNCSVVTHVCQHSTRLASNSVVNNIRKPSFHCCLCRTNLATICTGEILSITSQVQPNAQDDVTCVSTQTTTNTNPIWPGMNGRYPPARLSHCLGGGWFMYPSREPCPLPPSRPYCCCCCCLALAPGIPSARSLSALHAR